MSDDLITELLSETKPAFVVTEKHRQAAAAFRKACVFDVDTAMEFGGEIMSGLDEKAMAMWLAYQLPDHTALVKKLRRTLDIARESLCRASLARPRRDRNELFSTIAQCRELLEATKEFADE